jgi:hypothetical protein
MIELDPMVWIQPSDLASVPAPPALGDEDDLQFEWSLVDIRALAVRLTTLVVEVGLISNRLGHCRIPFRLTELVCLITSHLI